MVREEVQNPNPARHFHPRLNLQIGSDSEPSEAVGDRGSHGLRHRPQWERLHREGGSHVLGPAGADLPGGNEHEAHLIPTVEQLKRAVVMRELRLVRVLHRHVLRECEVDGAIGDCEARKLHCIH